MPIYQVSELNSIPLQNLKKIPFNPIHVVINSPQEMKELTWFLKSDKSQISHLSIELSPLKQTDNSSYLSYFKTVKGAKWFFDLYGSFSDFFYTCKIFGDFLEQDTKLTYLKIENINHVLLEHYFHENVGEALEMYVKNIFEKNVTLKMLEVTDKRLAQAFYDNLDFSHINAGLYVVNFKKGYSTQEERLGKRTPHNINTRVLEVFKESLSSSYSEDLHETCYFLTQSIEPWIAATGKTALENFLSKNEQSENFKKEDFSFNGFTVTKVEHAFEESKPSHLENEWTFIL